MNARSRVALAGCIVRIVQPVRQLAARSPTKLDCAMRPRLLFIRSAGFLLAARTIYNLPRLKLCLPALPSRQFGQLPAYVQMMPELSRYHRSQPHFHRKAWQGTNRYLAESPPPVVHRRNVKISRPPQRFFTQQLSDKGRLRVDMKAVQGSAENHLASTVYRRRQPACGQEAQQMFVPKLAEFPAWVQSGQKIEDFF